MATKVEWDGNKDRENQKKHGVAFALAQFAFADPRPRRRRKALIFVLARLGAEF